MNYHVLFERIPQDVFYISLNIVLIPLFYVFEVLYVIPALYTDTTRYYMHVIIGTYLLHQLVGNLVLGARGPGTIRRRLLVPDDDWRFCTKCDCQAPPRSWHCKSCNVCILKRDHHCNFFGCCVGYFNHRYFFMFVIFMFLSTLYTLYLNIQFMLFMVPWDLKWYSYIKFLFPLFAAATEMSEESFYVLLLVINVVVILFTGYLLYHHGILIIRGKITPEDKQDFEISYDNGWVNNLRDVFGVNWLQCWISPFVKSELPGDGIRWTCFVKRN